MKRLTGIAFLAALACSSGCTRLKLAYGWADTYVESEITDYLDLTSSQEHDMEKTVDGYFAWHRRIILPRMAKQFTAMADVTEAGRLDEATFSTVFDGIDDAMKDSVAQAIAPSAALLAEQDDKQTDHFAKELADREKDLRKEDAKPEAKKIAKRFDQSEEFLEDFVGSLTDSQREALKARVVATIGDRSKMWIDNRHYHVDKLIAAMHAHADEAAITTLLNAWWLREGEQKSPAHAAASEAAMNHLKDGLWAFLVTITPEQKSELVKHLRGYAADLTQLSRENS